MSDEWGGRGQISGATLLRKWSLVFFRACSHQLVRCVGRWWSSGSPWLPCGTSTITMWWAQVEREAHICTVRCVVQVSGEVRLCLLVCGLSVSVGKAIGFALWSVDVKWYCYSTRCMSQSNSFQQSHHKFLCCFGWLFNNMQVFQCNLKIGKNVKWRRSPLIVCKLFCNLRLVKT